MRKYQQLLLLLVSIFCFVSFLFYRHEYLKLRSVLSVLSFFGRVPANNASCVVFGADFKEGLAEKYNFLEPRSSWTRLKHHYIYSSFWEESVDGGGYVRTLTVGPLSSFASYQCRVWFERGDKIVSESGVFKYDLDILSKTSKAKYASRKYFLKCHVTSKPGGSSPYGVLWSAPSETAKVFSPVFTKKKTSNVPVVCVKPDYSGYSKTNIIEFISFYNRVGVKNFIIYDSGIQHSLFPFLESIASRGRIPLSVTVLPWNFPETDVRLEYLALKDDCLSRTFGISKLVGILSWNEYILPANGDINALRRDAATGFINLSFNTWLCCSDYPDDPASLNSWPEFLRKTTCLQEPSEDAAFLNLKSYVDVRKSMNYVMPANIATKRRYDECTKLPAHSVVTPILASFTDVASHELLLLWKSHLNTSAIFN